MLANPFDAAVAAVFQRLSPAQTQELTTKLLHVKLRADFGGLSSLEAGIEQMKLLNDVCHFPEICELIHALEAFNDGDDAELRFFIGKD